jgi:hypothetical protein
MSNTYRAFLAILVISIVTISTTAAAETVFVKYRGNVDLAHFNCTDITRSSLVRRVCYDAANKYMLISLNGTFYHYCEIDAATVEGLQSAASMGQYFNVAIKGRFDCRMHPVPSYD